MRIYEITDRNRSILAISYIDLSNIDFEYNKLEKLLTILIALKTPSRNRRVLNDIENFESLISKVLKNKLLDRTDPDIIELLEKLNKMQRHINDLRSQLIL